MRKRVIVMLCVGLANILLIVGGLTVIMLDIVTTIQGIMVTSLIILCGLLNLFVISRTKT